ncbi:MAG: dynamin family protein, partial [Noviherbaspirillum sp.]
MGSLIQDFEGYSQWRKDVAAALGRYRSWLNAARLSDADSDERLANLSALLAQERMTVAFVAEFSRGKSELINAIFFAGYGQRILPSAAGRTTMCPTELLYDAARPPSIRLLPVETREDFRPASEFRERDEAWTVLPLDTASPAAMREAFSQVSLTSRVPLETARRYGLCGADEDEPAADADGMVEVPRWRHAIVNFPHPLLEQGLVIVDTPGLNAIGSEPDLTLDLIPNAHVVLFILAADTGVTKSDIAVWRRHIGPGAGRIAVLNKIDGLWDALRTPGEIEEQLARQVRDAARTLGLEPSALYPVSAQKGLTGKIAGDAALLAKSRLPALEEALSGQLVPARREIVRARLEAGIGALALSRQALLDARLRHTVEQLLELKSLRGKNRNIIAHMARRIDLE